MSDTSSRVQSVIDRFVSELTAIAREEAAKIVLGGITPSGRVRKAASNSAGGHGAKRSPENIEALQSKLLGYVKSHPGLRIEQINEQLGTSTKDLALPIRKLIAAKQLRVQGQRRATKYFAGGKGTPKKNGRTSRDRRPKR